MIRLSLFLSCALALSSFARVEASVTACPSAATLDDLVDCLVDDEHMPARDSNGFIIPSDADLFDWYDAATAMLEIATNSSLTSCGSIELKGNLAELYEYVSFLDEDSGVEYCVLAEKASVGDPEKKAWGTFITNTNPGRKLHFQAPHPGFDTNTGQQTAIVFQATNATSFLLSGAHRYANTRQSFCQNKYSESDAAHNDKHMFHATTRAIQVFYDSQYDDFVVVQLHGFGPTTCETDMFMTYGRSIPASSGECLELLQSNLRSLLPGSLSQPNEPGEEPCKIWGTSNTQGRMLNLIGQDQVCNIGANTYTGRFIHIEQEYQYRDVDPAVYAENIAEAIAMTFPAGQAWDCTPLPKRSGPFGEPLPRDPEQPLTEEEAAWEGEPPRDPNRLNGGLTIGGVPVNPPFFIPDPPGFSVTYEEDVRATTFGNATDDEPIEDEPIVEDSMDTSFADIPEESGDEDVRRLRSSRV